MKNKGLSPLIATVLLMAFAIAIAAIVSTYIMNQTKEFKPEKLIEDSLLCDEVSLGYQLVNNKMCISAVQGTTTKRLDNILIINKGKFSIYGYRISVDGSTNTIDSPVNIGREAEDISTTSNHLYVLKPGKGQPLMFGIKPANAPGIEPDERKVVITPIIKNPEVENEKVVCSKSSLTIDYAQWCVDNEDKCDGPIPRTSCT